MGFHKKMIRIKKNYFCCINKKCEMWKTLDITIILDVTIKIDVTILDIYI